MIDNLVAQSLQIASHLRYIHLHTYLWYKILNNANL